MLLGGGLQPSPGFHCQMTWRRDSTVPTHERCRIPLRTYTCPVQKLRLAPRHRTGRVIDMPTGSQNFTIFPDAIIKLVS